MYFQASKGGKGIQSRTMMAKIRKPQSETIRPTKAEYARRVAFCAQMIRGGAYDGQIKKACAKAFDVSPRTVEAYLRHARGKIIAESGKTREVHRAESFAFYQNVRANLELDAGTRIRACERIDRLLGLEAKTRFEYQPVKQPIEVEQRRQLDALLAVATVEELEILQELMDELARRASLAGRKVNEQTQEQNQERQSLFD